MEVPVKSMEPKMKIERSKRKSVNWTPWFFITPHLVIFGLFFLVPILFGIYISFTSWDLVGKANFVGLANYKEILFQKDSSFYTQFHNGLKNTFIFVILSVPCCIVVPLLLASALNAKPRFHKLFQSIFYMPSLFSISAVVIIWTLMFNVNQGPVNNLLGKSILWTSTQPYAWAAIVIVTVWWCIGGNMIIYQAALNGISKDYYEAAEIDGASSIQKFFKITLPSIRGQILYTVVITTIAQFNIYGQPLMLTGGGPIDSTRVLLMDIQQNAFGSGQSIAGIASAMAFILGLCIMIVSLIQFLFLRNRD
ncbi:carbohydrate ABC transporter membrane protein 1 (CUT1 family) [Scopulibacillus darangshiensis]|uniref:Carbohydrate ABC transporter membrane protein 1 (CUT1 family) n=1 Tax=Scopulibacillus darangshiensis TaxID=442528 RepID=A0A4R2NIV2_9BACL|nr:sugar ABC transporter permease [Scopulibacillus darangshiensis]TCP21330.1 carbohydrate ABC transporter membrane protein 1 (CUT1 family) [Scopulibacillus darangshiensis]